MGVSVRLRACDQGNADCWDCKTSQGHWYTVVGCDLQRAHNLIVPELACSEFFRCRTWRARAVLLETLVCWLELELLALMAKALLRVTLTYFSKGCSGQSSAIKTFQGRKKG